MDLKQVTYFVRVAELGSFSRASETLLVSQPFVSKQIRLLEEEFGSQLFQRNGRGVMLTEKGKVFLIRARNILDEIQGARNELAAMQELPAGQVVIGAVSAVCHILGANLVTRFSELFPKASLKIIEGKGWEVNEWLAAGRVDIGILNDPAPRPDIEITPLVKRELCLVSSESTTKLAPGQKVPFRELAHLPLIMPGRPQPMRQMIEEVAKREGIKLTSVHNVIGRAYTVELVRQGLGYLMIPRNGAEELKDTNHLQINEIIEPRISTTFACAVSKKSKPLELMRRTASLVHEIMKKTSQPFTEPILRETH